jgi:mono/diheme cytochrome c family protein
MQHRITSFLTTGMLAALAFLAWDAPAVAARDDRSRSEFYSAKVKPIFEANCARCHGGVNHRGGLNIDTREALLKGGHTGPAIVPGEPAKSLLVTLIRHEGPADDPKSMPPNKEKLSDLDIQVVETWIKMGAAMPPAPTQ